MEKYIDADKLIAQIKELNLVTKTYDEQVAFNNALAMVVEIITSLQQEQPSEDLEKVASREGFDYVDNIVQESPGHRWNDHDVEFGYRDGFIAGAEWGAEQFAKIVRANLSEIGNDAQFQFEQLYFEITGNKMYGGYND